MVLRGSPLGVTATLILLLLMAGGRLSAVPLRAQGILVVVPVLLIAVAVGVSIVAGSRASTIPITTPIIPIVSTRLIPPLATRALVGALLLPRVPVSVTLAISASLSLFSLPASISAARRSRIFASSTCLLVLLRYEGVLWLLTVALPDLDGPVLDQVRIWWMQHLPLQLLHSQSSVLKEILQIQIVLFAAVIVF